MITIGSLFSGACDGIALGLEWAGLGPVLWHAESDPWRRKVLARHRPNARIFHDVREIWTTQLDVPPVDMLVGGFPCVGFSNAGKRKGFDDERSALWSEFARLLGDLRPALAFVENTAAATVRGWLRVLGDLTELGFDAEWISLRGTDVGWPVARERVFLLACTGQVGRQKLRETHDVDGGDASGDIAHDRVRSVLRQDPTMEMHCKPGLPSTIVLNPAFVETLMGFPIGWSALEPSETPHPPSWSSRPSVDSDDGTEGER